MYTRVNAKRLTDMVNEKLDNKITYNQIIYWINSGLFNSCKKRGNAYLFDANGVEEALFIKDLIVDKHYSINDCKEMLDTNFKSTLDTENDSVVAEKEYDEDSIAKLIDAQNKILQKQLSFETKLEKLMNHLGVNND